MKKITTLLILAALSVNTLTYTVETFKGTQVSGATLVDVNDANVFLQKYLQPLEGMPLYDSLTGPFKACMFGLKQLPTAEQKGYIVITPEQKESWFNSKFHYIGYPAAIFVSALLGWILHR
jgi:hypothetical protein